MGSIESYHQGIPLHIGASSMCIQLVTRLLLTTAVSTLPQYGPQLPEYYHFNPSDAKTAVVTLVPGGDSQVTGKLTLIQGPGHVRIYGEILGLKPGPHGPWVPCPHGWRYRKWM